MQEKTDRELAGQYLTKDRILQIIGNYENDPQQLIAILLDIQAASGRNYVEKEWAEIASKVLNISISKIYDVLTFYSMFSTVIRGEYVIEICKSTPCHFSEGADVVRWFETAAGIKTGETTADNKITLVYTSCIGACETGPAVKINDQVFGNLTEEKVKNIVKSCCEGNLQDIQHPEKNTLNEIGPDDFGALRKAITMTSEDIIDEVMKAKLLGRGGAAYPAGKKWEHLLHIHNDPKFIVCNADEGEPGTFKDRLIMETMPYKLIEGIIIAGFVFRAKEGHIYVRGEYRKIQKKLIAAVNNARALGLLGKNILGAGFNFDIHIISGAGAYVCGENSALLNSTEGRVGRPRIKPPHLAEVGLFLKPTLVNNVETFMNIPDIVNMGGEAFLRSGHIDSGGAKLICLSGHVNNRGVKEIYLGKKTLRDIVHDPDLGGGIRGGRKLKFLHLGGQSGPICGADQLDTVYSYTDLWNSGLAVGSGAVVVMDESVSILEYLKGVTEFFIHESCGKCVPCREGNLRLLGFLQKLSQPGAACGEDLENLRRLIRTMTDASFCGLGQTAAAALSSAWKNFKNEFEANIKR